MNYLLKSIKSLAINKARKNFSSDRKYISTVNIFEGENDNSARAGDRNEY